MSENTKVDLKKVLSISGQSGLFQFISQAKAGIIVESLSDQKRMCVSSSTKVSSLSDIAIYTNDKELALKDVLLKVNEKEGGKASISSKSTPEELKAYFALVLPDYDRERVYVSHIKKIVEWYNLLQQNSMLDFADDEVAEDTTTETPEAEVAPEEKAAPKKVKKDTAEKTEKAEKAEKPAAKKTTKKKAAEE